jgi:probable phosphoglycerate mutase
VAIVLVRHGETALNAARVLQPADTALSQRGLAQARALARRLAATGRVRAVLSSDLPRAWSTAQAVAEPLRLHVVGSALLRERDFGALRGRAYDTLGFDPLAMVDAPPDGESAAAFAQRAHAAFDAMRLRHALAGGDLLVVSHGLLIRALLAGPLGQCDQVLRGLRLGNTAVSIFDAAPPHALQLLNCTRHLDGFATDDAAALSGG